MRQHSTLFLNDNWFLTTIKKFNMIMNEQLTLHLLYNICFVDLTTVCIITIYRLYGAVHVTANTG